MSGEVSYHAGRQAEDCVAREYDRRGCPVIGRRWRGAGGEIDLIARDGAGLIFVEVKKGRDFSSAAARVSARQVGRIFDAATEFVAGEPRGQLTEMRFDVALVDHIGRIEILESALAA